MKAVLPIVAPTNAIRVVFSGSHFADEFFNPSSVIKVFASDTIASLQTSDLSHGIVPFL